MATFLAALLVFAAAFIGLAIGVIMSDRCLKGTCGGMNNIPGQQGKSACDVCLSIKSTSRPEEDAQAEQGVE